MLLIMSAQSEALNTQSHSHKSSRVKPTVSLHVEVKLSKCRRLDPRETLRYDKDTCLIIQTQRSMEVLRSP